MYTKQFEYIGGCVGYGTWFWVTFLNKIYTAVRKTGVFGEEIQHFNSAWKNNKKKKKSLGLFIVED